MSVPDSDTMSLHSMKKSAFKLFGRKKSRKSKRSKLLQLPDSAVSAKTREGARHIAISIPKEYDHLDNVLDTRNNTPSQNKKLPSQRIGPITVLKPVKEVRESGSSYSASQSNQGKRDSRLSAGSPEPGDLLSPETVRTLENYYTQLIREQKENEAQESSTTVKLPEPSQIQKSYISVSLLDRQDSERGVDLSRASGAGYGTSSVSNNVDHSRGISIESTASNINPLASNPVKLQLDLPLRSSSISKISRSLEAELAQSFARVNKLPQEINSNPISCINSEKAESFTSASQTSPIIFGTAETAQAYNSVGIEIIRGHTPTLPSPAPTRRLPDVPESPLVPSFMPRPSPPPSEVNRAPPMTIQTSRIAARNTRSSSTDSTQAFQRRQDRVRARKERDIAALRDRNAQSSSDISRKPSQSIQSDTAQQNTKGRSLTQEDKLPICQQNTLSAIMLVADLVPIIGIDYISNMVAPLSVDRMMLPKGLGSRASFATLSAKGTHTPPRSLASSSFSDSETIPRDENRSRGRSARGALDSRRQERRYKRNMSLKEKELDARLLKIERDNAILLDALSGIAKSFGELNKVLPRSQPRRDSEILLGSEMEGLERRALSPVSANA